MEGKNAIQLKNVTKRFGKVIANDVRCNVTTRSSHGRNDCTNARTA